MLFVTALIACAALVLLLRSMAHHVGVVDHPGGRKQHEHPTPTVGGVAMFLAVALTLYVANAYTAKVGILLGCAAALVVLGVLDDKHDLNVRVRMLIQVVVSLMVVLGADGTITHLGSLFALGDISLGPLAVPFSMIAFVGGINAMNMIDGADGMAGKMTVISLVGVVAVFYLSDATDLLPLAITMLGALTGFLLFNTRIFVSRAWVFMGDAGSMWLGLALGWFMSQVTRGETAAEPALVFWLFGIPLVDTLAVIMRRVRRKASPFSPDRTHIHHVFQHNGLSVGRTVFVLSIVQCIMVGIGVGFYAIHAPGVVVFWSFVLMMAAYFYLMHRFHDVSLDMAKIADHAGEMSGERK